LAFAVALVFFLKAQLFEHVSLFDAFAVEDIIELATLESFKSKCRYTIPLVQLAAFINYLLTGH
jgi:hypothetical protein